MYSGLCQTLDNAAFAALQTATDMHCTAEQGVNRAPRTCAALQSRESAWPRSSMKHMHAAEALLGHSPQPQSGLISHPAHIHVSPCSPLCKILAGNAALLCCTQI